MGPCAPHGLARRAVRLARARPVAVGRGPCAHCGPRARAAAARADPADRAAGRPARVFRVQGCPRLSGWRRFAAVGCVLQRQFVPARFFVRARAHRARAHRARRAGSAALRLRAVQVGAGGPPPAPPAVPPRERPRQESLTRRGRHWQPLAGHRQRNLRVSAHGVSATPPWLAAARPACRWMWSLCLWACPTNPTRHGVMGRWGRGAQRRAAGRPSEPGRGWGGTVPPTPGTLPYCERAGSGDRDR